MSLSAFYKNIKSFGQGIDNIFSGGDEAYSFPNGKGVKLATQDVNGRLWNQDPGYSFRVVKAGNGYLSPLSDFVLQINPQSLDQDEPFSDTITPTQTGIVVEHEGFILKKIQISGTTGVHPLRGQEGVRSTGQPYSGSGKSGYQHCMEFINWIRSYKQQKRNSSAKDLRMVFLNHKDNEEWFVEIVRASRKRQVPQSTLYIYNIEMVILGKAVPPDPIEDDIFDALLNIDKTIEEVQNSLDTAVSIFNSVVDLGNNIEDSLNDTFIRPLEKIRDSFNSITNATNEIIFNSFPRHFYENMLNETKIILDNASDLFGFGSSGYNKSNGRQNTSIAGFTTTNTTVGGTLPPQLKFPYAPATWPKDAPYPPDGTYSGSISDPNSIWVYDPSINPETGEEFGWRLNSSNPLNTPPTRSFSIDIDNPDSPWRVDANGKIVPKDFNPELPYPGSISGVDRDGNINSTWKLNKEGNFVKNDLGDFTPPEKTTPIEDPDGFFINYNFVPTQDQVRVLFALYSVEANLYKILANEEFFTNPYNFKKDNASVFQFQDQINLLDITSVEEYIVPPNTTLEQIAIEKIGNANSWIDLKILNNLEYPYIATKTEVEAIAAKTEPISTIVEDGSLDNIKPKKSVKTRVLRPGDKMLIPTFTNVGESKNSELGILKSSFLDARTINLSYQEFLMGVDIKLNSDRDIDINSRNDVSMVVGYDNASQSIMTKLGVERGSYKLAPEFGFGIVPGSSPINSAKVMSQSIKDSIKQDPRYEDVRVINITRDGAVYRLKLKVILVNDDQPVPLSVQISG